MYQWLTTDRHDLDTLLRLSPEAVKGKYVAVTSLDSGPLTLNADEVSAGWRSHNNIAYSPRIGSVEKLAHGECAGFDEWYIFETPSNLGQICTGNIFEAHLEPGLLAVFVNYGGFGFHTHEMQPLVDLFWSQLDWILPESYVADGNLLNFVTRDKNIFAAVFEALRKEPY